MPSLPPSPPPPPSPPSPPPLSPGFPFEKITGAIRCTAAESEQGARYERPWTKALCYVAVHLEDADAALTSALGTLVRADARRMEELREQLDDDGMENHAHDTGARDAGRQRVVATTFRVLEFALNACNKVRACLTTVCR